MGYRASTPINTVVNSTQMQSDLRRHQQGETDFSEFCEDMAASGVYKWVIDFETMNCQYYDKRNHMVYSEVINVP